MILGFKADKVIVEIHENEEIIRNIIIGIYDKNLSKKGTYSALLGLDILEGSEENEPITKNSL